MTGRFICALLVMAGLASAAEYFPLRDGNVWTYRNAETGDSFEVVVGTPVLIDETVYYSLRGYAAERVLVRYDEASEQVVYRDEEKRQDFPLISFARSERYWWHAPLRPCDQEGQTLEQPGRHDGAAGPLTTVEIRYRSFDCADTGVLTEQFADNIGMLRRTVQTIVGPRDYDLVYARVGSFRLGTLPQATFAATADLHRASDVIRVTMRLEANQPNKLLLRFPTAQEYEVVLKDPEGRLLWKWSDGKAFLESAHDREVYNLWSATVTMPRPALPGSEPKPGSYMIEAWLTTAEGSPRFAVSVPLTITPATGAAAEQALAFRETHEDRLMERTGLGRGR